MVCVVVIKYYLFHLLTFQSFEKINERPVTWSSSGSSKTAPDQPIGLKFLDVDGFDQEDETQCLPRSTAAKAIKILQDKIQTPPVNCSEKTRKLLAKFQCIIKGTEIIFPGGLHCETLLATLGKYFELSLTGGGDANLISTFKVFFYLHIACLI